MMKSHLLPSAEPSSELSKAHCIGSIQQVSLKKQTCILLFDLQNIFIGSASLFKSPESRWHAVAMRKEILPEGGCTAGTQTPALSDFFGAQNCFSI